MGVKRCFKNGCDNIMCDRYSSNFGYICEECFEELKKSRMPIDVFMELDKRKKPNFDYENEFKNLSIR